MANRKLEEDGASALSRYIAKQKADGVIHDLLLLIPNSQERSSCLHQVESAPCSCAIGVCPRPRPLRGLRRPWLPESPASPLISPSHCSHALNVNFRPRSRGGAASEDDSSLV